MLDPAQKFIGLFKLCCDDFCEVPGARENREGLAGFLRTQACIPAAPDQLLGLCIELNFTNATTAELDIVACHGNFTAATMNVDLPFD